MNKEIIEIAAKVVKLPEDEVVKHYRELPEINAYYFYNPIRGGIGVIVDENLEKLGATSRVSFERHLQAFKDGRRN